MNCKWEQGAGLARLGQGGRWDAGPGPAGWSGCLSGLRRGIGQRGKGGMARGPLHGDDQIPRPPLSRCTLQMREVLEKGQPRSLSLSILLLGLNVPSAWPLSYSMCEATSVSQIKMIKMLLKKLSFLAKCMQESINSK